MKERPHTRPTRCATLGRALWVSAVLAVAIGWSVSSRGTANAVELPLTGAVNIRGGGFADTNLDGHALSTADSTGTETARRLLLSFAVDSQIPAAAAIRSATLTLTVM